MRPHTERKEEAPCRDEAVDSAKNSTSKTGGLLGREEVLVQIGGGLEAEKALCTVGGPLGREEAHYTDQRPSRRRRHSPYRSKDL